MALTPIKSGIAVKAEGHHTEDHPNAGSRQENLKPKIIVPSRAVLAPTPTLPRTVEANACTAYGGDMNCATAK